MVNDASIDDTGGVVRAAMVHVPTNVSLGLINHVHNQGKGAAVRTGMLAATGEAVLFMDADGSTHIQELDKLLPYLREGREEYDVVISSRYTDDSRILTHQQQTRSVLSKIFRIFVRCIFPLGVADTQNGFNLFSGSAARSIFAHLKTTGWAFDVEVLARARKLGYRICEVGIEWHNDERSKVRISGMVQMLVDVIRLRCTRLT